MVLEELTATHAALFERHVMIYKCEMSTYLAC